MSDQPKPNGAAPPQAPDPETVVTMAVASQAQAFLALGVPTDAVINVLCDVACNIVSGIEVAQLRQNLVNEMVKNLPQIVERHHQARIEMKARMSGLVLPGRG